MADDAADLGFATVYDTFAPNEAAPAAHLEDVKGSDWRNILVLGRAMPTGVYPETLALVGRARYMADELGCRVEVLLIGESLDAATEALKRYPIDTVYRVKAPDYAPIDHTAKLLEQVVRKRRPELVLVFQSRSGDAVTAYAANRLGVGFVTGANRIDLDTAQRKAVVTHESGHLHRFQAVTAMQAYPQFISVQRGLFRAPLEDPYASVKVHDLKAEAGRLAAIEVLGLQAPPPPTLETAERVVVAGARIRDAEELELARQLAKRLDAAFGITTGIVERGLAKDEGNVVGVHDHRIAPRLLVTVGVRGALDLLEGLGGSPLVCAIGCDPGDPIGKRAAYMVVGEVRETVQSVLDAL
ncbi:MAG: FAD-binding protein [Halobacteriales archaeon]|nr:FAD-binding protein [Halobacteriales archaeon]